MDYSKPFLGKIVDVIVDRPIGSKHPRHDYTYPINYGYTPDTLAPDGEELDAYVLGVNEPFETFRGKCIAILHRLDDNDDKLIVCTENECFQIRRLEVLFTFRSSGLGQRLFDNITSRLKTCDDRRSLTA